MYEIRPAFILHNNNNTFGSSTSWCEVEMIIVSVCSVHVLVCFAISVCYILIIYLYFHTNDAGGMNFGLKKKQERSFMAVDCELFIYATYN